MDERDRAYVEELRLATLAIVAVENLFREAADAVEAYLTEGISGVKQSRAEFAIAHLVSRSIADLRAGILLAASGFVVQSSAGPYRRACSIAL